MLCPGQSWAVLPHRSLLSEWILQMWICLEQIEGLGCAERDESILVGPVWYMWSLVPLKRCSFPRPVIPQAEQPHPMHWAGAGDAGSEWKA